MMLMCDYSELSEQNSRKFAKTCVEKKRRDRINRSLDELKNLMALTDEKARYQKLEKAEILEMTVKYVRDLKQTINNSIENYENGYRQCSEEIWNTIHTLPNLLPEQRQYLANCCQQMWSNRFIQRRHHEHHPYQRKSIKEKSLKINVNSSYSSSNLPSNFLSPTSPKLWKPYI